jgi:hypothetical protein
MFFLLFLPSAPLDLSENAAGPVVEVEDYNVHVTEDDGKYQ